MAAYGDPSTLLPAHGHDVEDFATSGLAVLISPPENVWAAEFASLPFPAWPDSQMRPLTRWLRERGYGLSATDFYGALGGLRSRARMEIDRSSAHDAILTPTLAQPPSKVGGLRNDADPAQDFENQKRFTPFTAPYNMSGQPAVSIPRSEEHTSELS